MADDDERRAASQWLDDYRARPTANTRNLPTAPDFEPSEELLPQPIGLA